MSDIIIKVYCIIEEGGKIILTQDLEGTKGWKFPGGHIKDGELVVDGVKREVREETGIEIEITGLVTIQDYIKLSAREHRQRVYLTAKKSGGVELMQASELKNMRWFSRAELSAILEQEFHPDHFRVLKKYMAGEIHPFIIESQS